MSTNAPHDVLVGEHQPSIRLLIESVGALVNCNFRFVPNRAGLRHALPFRRPDLLVLDKNLPPVNGLACLAEVPEAVLQKTILFDSTSATTLNIPLLQESFRIHAFQSLPTTPGDFVHQLAEMLGKNGDTALMRYTEPLQALGGVFARILADCYFFQYSGVLRVSGAKNLRHIHFCRGMPIFVSCSRLAERLITRELVDQKIINVPLEQLVRYGNDEFTLFSALIRDQLVNEERFFTYLEDFLFKILVNTARWPDAEFQLLYKESPFRVPPHEVNLIELVREVTWKCFPVEMLRREFPDLAVRHRRIANPYLPIENFQDDRVIMQFYNLLNGATDLQTILQSQMYTELEAYRILFLLETFRLIERVNPQDQAATQRPFEAPDGENDQTLRMDMHQVFEFLGEQNAHSFALEEPSEPRDAVPNPTSPMTVPFDLEGEKEDVYSSLAMKKEPPKGNSPSAQTKVEIPAVKQREATVQISELPLTRLGDYDRLGDYVLLKRLAAGGMGEIHLGGELDEEGLGDFVAVKKLLAELCEDESLITMFRDEARVVSQLDHKNIVHFREFIRQEDIYYIVMEYIAGRNMRDMIRACKKSKRPLPLNVSLHVIAQVCEGLHYAHTGTNKRGEKLHLIHRDINPQNILLSYDGEVKIIDFGIAKTAIQHTVTLVGQIKGKYSYMSPEQVEGKTLDLRSDIFSLGLVLYQLVTGKKCFNIRNEVELLTAIVECKFRAPREINPKLPPELESIVLKCLERDREQRYANTLQLRDVLQRFAVKYGLKTGTEQLKEFMRDIFADDFLAEQNALKQYRAAVALSTQLSDDDDEPTTRPDAAAVHLERGTVPDEPARPEWRPSTPAPARSIGTPGGGELGQPVSPVPPDIAQPQIHADYAAYGSPVARPIVRLKSSDRIPAGGMNDELRSTIMEPLSAVIQPAHMQRPFDQGQRGTPKPIVRRKHDPQRSAQESTDRMNYILIGAVCLVLTGIILLVVFWQLGWI
ncbi:MAG: serine/threonine protein kinase [Myxococcales bacterium]|nr:serine/threonine protein kinase [Myxococcales bacterium]